MRTNHVQLLKVSISLLIKVKYTGVGVRDALALKKENIVQSEHFFARYTTRKTSIFWPGRATVGRWFGGTLEQVDLEQCF